LTNLVQRALTGAIYVALTIFCMLFSMDTAFLFIFIINIFCLFEFYQILSPEARGIAKYGPILVSALIFFQYLIGFDQIAVPGDIEGMILLVLFGLMALEVLSSKSQPFQYLGTVILSFLYITISLVLFLRIGINYEEFIMSSTYFNGHKLLVIFILIWSSDTFAYLVGKYFGKHKLAPKISPKKTIEGAIGGLLGTVLVSWVLHITMRQFGLTDSIIIAVLVFVFGMLGDLLVSRLKRSMNIKDSGTLLPGHGGFLDRFDSLLLAGPIVYLYLTFVS